MCWVVKSGTSPESRTSVPVAPSSAASAVCEARAPVPELWLLDHKRDARMLAKRGLQNVSA